MSQALSAMGEYQQARTLDEDTLARRRRVLGEDHPDTLTSANLLANDFYTLGGYQQARTLYEDTLARRRRVQGEDDSDTLATASNLARLLSVLGEHQQARTLTEDALARVRRVLGEDHPDALSAATNHVVVLYRLGEYDQAAALTEDTLARRRRVLGEVHHDTLAAATNHAQVLYQLGEYQAGPHPSTRTRWPAHGECWAKTTPTPSSRLTISPATCPRWVNTNRHAPSTKTPWPADAGCWARTTRTPDRRRSTWRRWCWHWGKLRSSGLQVMVPSREQLCPRLARGSECKRLLPALCRSDFPPRLGFLLVSCPADLRRASARVSRHCCTWCRATKSSGS